MEAGDCPPLNMNAMQITSVKSVLKQLWNRLTGRRDLTFLRESTQIGNECSLIEHHAIRINKWGSFTMYFMMEYSFRHLSFYIVYWVVCTQTRRHCINSKRLNVVLPGIVGRFPCVLVKIMVCLTCNYPAPVIDALLFSSTKNCLGGVEEDKWRLRRIDICSSIQLDVPNWC